MATNALITKANGLAMLVAPLSGGDDGVLSGAPDVAPAPPVVLPDVWVAASDVVTVLVLDKVAKLKVVLRDTGTPVPVPIAPVPTGTVVTLAGITVVTTGRRLLLLLLLTLLMTDCSDDTSDETDAEAAEVTDAAETEVLDTDTADEADTAVADDAFSLTDATTPDPPAKEN